MNNITVFKDSNVNTLKYTHGKLYPRNLISSEEGLLAIVYLDSIVIGTIGLKPQNHNKKYILSKILIDIDFKIEKSKLIQTDINFDCSISSIKDFDYSKRHLLMNENYETGQFNIVQVDWSPLDTLTNKCYLGVMTCDGRLVIVKQNKIGDSWEKEFDLLILYHNFYRENLLKSECNVNEKILFSDFDQLIELKEDLKLISFSWSKLVRQSRFSQYCFLSLLSASGIMSIWKVINSNSSSRCELIFHCRLNCKPKIIQFCDLSHDYFYIIIFSSDQKITSYGFKIQEVQSNDDDILITQLKNSIIELNSQSKSTQVHNCLWSVKHRMLIVGYISELLFIRFDDYKEELEDIPFTKKWLNLPSTEEIRRIVINAGVAFVISRDGFLYRIDLNCTNLHNLQLGEMVFENKESVNCVEFIDLFISPNGVHLGLLTKCNSNVAKQDSQNTTCDILLIQLMNVQNVMSILMDDNKPFCRKQDALEEIRHAYFNSKEVLHHVLHNLSITQNDLETISLHNLQFLRYLYILFGYPLNMNHEFESYSLTAGIKCKSRMGFNHILHIETVIISRNLSYWLDGFIDFVSFNKINQDDCFFVLSLCAKFQRLSWNTEIIESIEAAKHKSRALLKSEFCFDDSEIDLRETQSNNLTCPICDELCPFNLFASKCSNNHVIPRCCKSLELCTDAVKKCSLCGAIEKLVDTSGLSVWRLEIINSNCPLCDGMSFLI